MSDELQNDAVETEIVGQVADQETGAELATDTEGQQEQTDQAAKEAARKAEVQNVINRKHREAETAKRDLAVANEKIAQIEAAQREQKAAQASNIPPLPGPDEFGDLPADYESRVREYHEAITRKAQFDAEQNAITSAQQQNQKLLEDQATAAIQQATAKYVSRATELGMDINALQDAGNVLNALGASQDLSVYLLDDEVGPLITAHLANNPGQASQLIHMNHHQQGEALVAIKQHIAATVQALKPKASNAPPPPDTISGAGVETDTDAKRYPNSGGATFS